MKVDIVTTGNLEESFLNDIRNDEVMLYAG